MPILDTHIDGYDDVDENGRFKKRYTPTVKSKTDQVPAALIDSLTSSRTRITSAEHVLNNVGFKMFSAEVIRVREDVLPTERQEKSPPFQDELNRSWSDSLRGGFHQGDRRD